MLNPAQPASGATVNVFVEVADPGWGVKNLTASYVLAGKEYKLIPEIYSPSTLISPVTSFLYKLTIPPIENVDSITIKMVALDNAGNQATSEYTLRYQTPVPTVAAPPNFLIVGAALIIIAIIFLVFVAVKRKKKTP
jgi:hypothetical protein